MNAPLARAELARFGALSYAGFFLLGWPLVLVWLLGGPGSALLDGPAVPLVTLLAAWPIPVYCFLENPRTRGFERLLPIARRELRLTKLAVLGAVMLAPVVGAVGLAASWLASQGQPLVPLLAKGVDLLGATLLLAVACVLFEPADDAADSPDLRLLAAGALVTGSAVMLLPAPLVGVVALLVAVGLLPHLLQAPAAAQPQPALEPPSPGAAEAEQGASRVPLGLPALHGLVLHSLFLRTSYLEPAVALAAACSTALLSGPIAYVAVFPLAFFQTHASAALRALAPLDSLPVPRSQLALYVAAPALAAALGLAALATFVTPFGAAGDEVLLCSAAPYLRMPDFAWHRPGVRETRTVRAPWGETVQADARRIPGLGVKLYNSYGVARSSSLRLLGWQLARAARELYGVNVAPEKLLALVWAHDREPSWNPRDPLQGSVGDLHLSGDVRFGELFGPSPLARFGRQLAWLALLWLAGVLLTFASRAPQPQRAERWRSLAPSLPALLILAHAVMAGMLALWIDYRDLGLLYGSLLHAPIQRALGSGALLWLALDAAALSAGVAFVVQRMRRSELAWLAS